MLRKRCLALMVVSHEASLNLPLVLNFNIVQNVAATVKINLISGRRELRKCGELSKKTASIAPFNGNRYYVFQSGAPPGSVAQRTCWCLFLLHLFRFRVCQRRGAAHEDWSRDVAYSNYVASRRQLWGRQTTVTMWR